MRLLDRAREFRRVAVETGRSQLEGGTTRRILQDCKACTREERANLRVEPVVLLVRHASVVIARLDAEVDIIDWMDGFHDLKKLSRSPKTAAWFNNQQQGPMQPGLRAPLLRSRRFRFPDDRRSSGLPG